MAGNLHILVMNKKGRKSNAWCRHRQQRGGPGVRGWGGQTSEGESRMLTSRHCQCSSASAAPAASWCPLHLHLIAGCSTLACNAVAEPLIFSFRMHQAREGRSRSRASPASAPAEARGAQPPHESTAGMGVTGAPRDAEYRASVPFEL